LSYGLGDTGGLGDTACGFVWQATMFLLAYFYTDVFGLSAGIMGTLFLVSRVLDAVTDPLMGLLVDRTRTRHGSARSCCGAPSRLASSAC
jgi:Na+/melibiose symporter-like transporter